ncbi:MAG: chromosomal replication initiator protein DnaA [Chloroflexi bacterium]|nr:chromosomal replication initiator protein DnaA [Chloroflexota bacterium]
MAGRATPASTWVATLGQLELQVTRANFDTWLRDTVGLRQEDERFTVGAQNDFATEWLATRLRPLIARTLARVLGHPVDVQFEVMHATAPEPPVLLSEPGGGTTEVPPFLRRTAAVPPALNSALTFDTFVAADENRLAHASALRCAEEPGSVTPLIIFGASGLGKTHLLNAIGHVTAAAGAHVIYAPAERFGNDYVRALPGGIEAFRRRYRSADVLLIDDVQFLEGKEKFQEEFFHTFNDLHAAGAQIVITADRAPAHLSGLMEALRSRLQWGLTVDLQKPGFETRLAILRAKMLRQALRLPEEALHLIAEKCCPSVRELEGYLNRVLAFLPLVGGHATREVVERALSPLAPLDVAVRGAPERPTEEEIVASVTRRTGVSPADLRGRSRARDVTYARHLAMYLLREDGGKTPAEIGRMFSHRDHSTVIGAVQRIAMEATTRAETRADIAWLREALAAPAAAAAAG